MNEPIISVSGIRGIFGTSLRPDNITKYVKAFADFSKKKRIVIGRDGRVNGDILERITESVLLFAGCEVINLGIVPTPTVAMAVNDLDAGGGIAITASHNPQKWNGLKFINSKGIFLDKDEVAVFRKQIDKADINYTAWNKVKQIEYYPDFYKKHIAKVLDLSFLNIRKIRKRNFKILLDCSNASGSFIVPELLKNLNCEIEKLDCNGTGVFTRKPEPVPENLRKTCRIVKETNSDIGIVIDPDADRLVIITEKGTPFIEENTIVTVLNNVLKNTPQSKRKAVVNLSTTRAVDDIVKNHSGKLFRSPVGEVNVLKKMIKLNAIAGGEGSGGVIIPESHFGRDALTGVAVILNEFADYNGTVSEYKESLPKYVIIKNHVDLSNTDPGRIIDFLNHKYEDHSRNNEDGLRIDFEDSWINFRISNTEPIMRIIAEAPNEMKTTELMHRFMNYIGKLF